MKTQVKRGAISHYLTVDFKKQDLYPYNIPLTWNTRFEHDVWYVDNLSLVLDIKVLLLTMLKVIQSDGISAAVHTTI